MGLLAAARAGLLAGFGAGVLLGAAAALLLAWAVVASGRSRRRRRGALAVLRVSGPIGGGSPLQPGVAAEPVLRALVQARRERWVRGLVLRINTPGGAVGTTQEIAEEIGRVRAAPQARDRLGPRSLRLGRVLAGLRLRPHRGPSGRPAGQHRRDHRRGPVLQRLLEKVGAERQKVLSGAHKDLMALERPWDEDELALLGEMNEAIFSQFVDAVAKGRAMDPAAVRAQADGRVFAASLAVDLGFCDRLGNFEDALALAREMAKLPERAPAIDLQPSRNWLLGRLLG